MQFKECFIQNLLIKLLACNAFFRKPNYCTASEGDKSIQQSKDEIANNFSCVFNDYQFETNLTCSFIQPANRCSNHNTSYHLRHRTNEVSCTCLEHFSNYCRLQCTFLPDQFNKFRGRYDLTLRSESEMGNREQNITRARIQSIKLEKPGNNLALVNKTYSSICLRWDNKRKSNHNFEIRWELAIEPNVNFDWSSPQYANLEETLCLKNLPYENYIYEVSVRRGTNVSDGHWSEYLKYTFQTDARHSETAKASAASSSSNSIFLLIFVCIFCELYM